MVRALESYSEGHGLDPHLGQLVFLSLILIAIASVCDSLSRSYSSPLYFFLPATVFHSKFLLTVPPTPAFFLKKQLRLVRN